MKKKKIYERKGAKRKAILCSGLNNGHDLAVLWQRDDI